MLQKTFENPLDSKEIKPINPNRNQFWIFIGRPDAEALVLWPSDVTSRVIEIDPDAGKGWGKEENRASEDEMDGITKSMDMSCEQSLGDSEGQESPACCSPWDHKELDMI